MPQFFTQQLPAIGSDIHLRGRDAKHIAGSLRLKPGEWLVLSSGEGRSFEAEILSASPHEVVARIIAERPERRSAPLTLAQAIVKGDKFEGIIQKAVELGVTRIIPFSSQRTVPQYVTAASARKLSRWQDIARSAAIQSGLPFRPAIDALIPFPSLATTFSQYRRVLIFWEKAEGKNEPLQASAETLVIIGPEGGFSNEEIAQARTQGAVSVSLGQQILRVETAATVAVAMTLAGMGYLSCHS